MVLVQYGTTTTELSRQPGLVMGELADGRLELSLLLWAHRQASWDDHT